ncbi:hypothetical protein D3C84_342430 [compost metagenome]
MQVAAVDLQVAGGGRPVTAEVVQGLADQLALKLVGSIAQTDTKRCGGRLGGRQRVLAVHLGRGFQAEVGRLEQHFAKALLGPRQHCGAVDGVLQLAHVARPGVALQQRQRGLAQRQAAQAQLAAATLAEEAAEQGDVLLSLAQRRHRDREHAEAMVEVGAELPGQHRALQVAVGGGEDAHVDLEAAVVADALQVAVLQHAQQLGLQGQRQLADLVEEQGALVGHLELAGAVVDGAGEGALDVAEQLALGHRLGQRRAVEVDQRMVGARRGQVDGLGHQLLADPGLAHDQHVEVGAGDHADLLLQLQHAGRQADDLVRARLVRQRVGDRRHRLLLQALDQQRIAQGRRGQRADQAQLLVVEMVELGRVVTVDGQRADQGLVGEQRQADAGMHLELLAAGQDQVVVRVGQLAVGGETHHVAGAGDGLQARMLAEAEAPAEHVRGQAIDRQRAEQLALVAQQGQGIAQQQLAQAVDQLLETILIGDAPLQVEGDAGQAVHRK